MKYGYEIERYKIFILVYLTIKAVIRDKGVSNAQIFWIIVGCSWIIISVLIVGGLLSLWQGNIVVENFELFQLKNLITSIVIVFITIRYPECVLMSKPQIVRAVNF